VEGTRHASDCISVTLHTILRCASVTEGKEYTASVIVYIAVVEFCCLLSERVIASTFAT
jgi:hypothetical protein